MNKTDSIYLDDILTAINNINSFVKKLKYNNFQIDTKTQFAVFHAFEIIGQATNKLSKELTKSHPDFPVRQTIEFRNLLIHGYDQIKLDIVWKTIKENLPVLKQQVTLILQDLTDAKVAEKAKKEPTTKFN